MSDLADVLETILDDFSCIEIQMKFGARQEVRDTTEIFVHKDCLELVHAGKGRTVIPLDGLLFMNFAPKGEEPHGWRRSDERH